MGECRGAMPHCRGRGGVPHKRTGRVGGKNYVRQAQLRKGLKGVNPKRQTNDNCLLRHSPADCYIVHTRHASEGGQIPSPLRGEG